MIIHYTYFNGVMELYKSRLICSRNDILFTATLHARYQYSVFITCMKWIRGYHFQGLTIARCDKQIAKIKEIITTYLYLYQRMWVSRGLRLSHKISHMCIFWKGRRDITTLEYGSITHTCKTQIKCSFRLLDRDSNCSHFKV